MEINDDRRQADEMVSDRNDMDARLEDYQRQMQIYRNLDMVDEYNRHVPIYNSLLENRNDAFGGYGRLVDGINDKVSRNDSDHQ